MFSKNIIGISGLEGSGKDAVSKYIQRISEEYWTIVKFADEVKLELNTKYPTEWNTHEWETGDRSYRDGIMPSFNLTRREVIRMYSEDRKDKEGQDYWSQRLIDKIHREPTLSGKYLISDVRFVQEIDKIHENNGIVIRIDVPCKECGLINSHRMDCSIRSSTEHVSERELDTYKGFDFRIINDSTLMDLYKKIENIIF